MGQAADRGTLLAARLRVSHVAQAANMPRNLQIDGLLKTLEAK
jgi:hypothetical protein